MLKIRMERENKQWMYEEKWKTEVKDKGDDGEDNDNDGMVEERKKATMKKNDRKKYKMRWY
jgi:hypothetical protein